MPPPTPIFLKKVDENQVSYFIWPNVNIVGNNYQEKILSILPPSLIGGKKTTICYFRKKNYYNIIEDMVTFIALNICVMLYILK